MDLSIVLPVFNEEENLNEVYSLVMESLNTLKLVHYEIIFVNDGSTDNSLDIIKDISENNSNVKYLSFTRNFGQQIAMIAGMEKSDGDKIVLLDSDLQDPPHLIPEMYNKIDEGFDIVYAKRGKRKGESFFKRISAKLFYRFLKTITRVDIPVDTGDFRIVTRRVVDVVLKMKEQHKFIRGQVAWTGYNHTFVTYTRDKREKGNSKYTTKKMMKFAMDGITSFSDFPLKLATYLGFIVSLISFVLIIWALYQRLIAKEYVQGWASLMFSILFIGGVQLMTIGVIGEYIARTAENVKNRPLYIIEEEK